MQELRQTSLSIDPKFIFDKELFKLMMFENYIKSSPNREFLKKIVLMMEKYQKTGNNPLKLAFGAYTFFFLDRNLYRYKPMMGFIELPLPPEPKEGNAGLPDSTPAYSKFHMKEYQNFVKGTILKPYYQDELLYNQIRYAVEIPDVTSVVVDYIEAFIADGEAPLDFNLSRIAEGGWRYNSTMHLEDVY